MKHKVINCKSEIGKTIGLIDTILCSASLIKEMDLKDTEIVEALKDLQNDKDLKFLLSLDLNKFQKPIKKQHNPAYSVDGYPFNTLAFNR